MPDPQENSADIPAGGIDLSGLRTRTIQQAQSELPQPQLAPPWEEEPRLQSASTSKLGKAYADAKQWLSDHEQHVSEKYLAPFREGLDRLGEDLQQAGESGHTPTGEALTGPTRALASGVGTLLKQVPVGRNLKETIQMSLAPPEFGPEGKALSKELKATRKTESAIDLSGLRTRAVPKTEGPQKSPFRIAAETPDKVSDFHSAVQNTEGAELSDSGLTLDVVRHQKPEQAGEKAIRTGVFFLPEKKSPYQRYYTTGRQGYGGTQWIEGRTTFENPIVAKGASGGKVPERAYDAINGQGAYDEMRQDVLDATVHGWGPRNDAELTQNVANVLERYGGNPDLAEDIVRNSKGGNTLPYAVQEHIVASSVRKAGHDGIIGYSKIKGQHRLSEVFDLRHDKYPISSQLFESKYHAKTEPPAPLATTPEAKARERELNLKNLGIGLTEMDPADAKNWVGYTNQKSLKIYRGVDDPSHAIEAGDYVSTSQESAQNYGKHVQELEVSPAELRYIRGHKDGDPLKVDQGGQTELIYAPKAARKTARPQTEQPSILTPEGAQPLADKLGAKVVGSVATGKTSPDPYGINRGPKDLDLRVEKYDSKQVEAAMREAGFEPLGSSVLSPKEIKASGKFFGSPGWKRAEHFENSAGQNVDIWHDAESTQSAKIDLSGLRVRPVGTGRQPANWTAFIASDGRKYRFPSGVTWEQIVKADPGAKRVK